MAIQRVSTVTFNVYGDGTTTEYVVDLASSFPIGFSVLYVYTTTQVNIAYHGNYPQTNNLVYTLVGSILTVTLPSAPATWVPPSIPDGLVGEPGVDPAVVSTPPALTFSVTAAY